MDELREFIANANRIINLWTRRNPKGILCPTFDDGQVDLVHGQVLCAEAALDNEDIGRAAAFCRDAAKTVQTMDGQNKWSTYRPA